MYMDNILLGEDGALRFYLTSMDKTDFLNLAQKFKFHQILESSIQKDQK